MSLKERVNLTKLKQQTAELFNKKRRTVDPNFVKRMQYTSYMTKKVNDLFGQVRQFLGVSAGKIQSEMYKQFFRNIDLY